MNYLTVYLVAAYMFLITDYKKKGGMLRALPLIGTRKDNEEELIYWFSPIWLPFFVCAGLLWVLGIIIAGIIVSMILLVRLVVYGDTAPSGVIMCDSFFNKARFTTNDQALTIVD